MPDRPEDEPPTARSDGVPEPGEQAVTLVVLVGIGLAALLLIGLLGYVTYARLS